MFVALFSWMGLVSFVYAAPKKGFEAVMTKTPSAAQLTFAPGEVKEVEVAFQNSGTTTWKNDGVGYVSAYTYDPKYRRSAFDPGTWLGPTQVKRIQESSVAPGGVATMRFTLHAPLKDGVYAETFQLAAEDVAWIPGGKFTLNITVTEAQTNTETETQRNRDTDAQDGETDILGLSEEAPKVRVGAPGYDATVLLRSAKKVVTPGGARVTYTVGVKNAGTATWRERRVQLPDIGVASVGDELFDASWMSSNTLALNTQGAIAPGQLDFVTFSFTAPRTVGEHLVEVALKVDGNVVEGGDILIPVDVTSGAPDAVTSPLRDGVMDKAEKITEPMLRVGVLIVDEETNDEVVVSCDCDLLHVKDEQGSPLADVPRGGSVRAFWKGGVYHYDVGRGLETTSFPIRLEPDVKNAVLTVTNFDRRLTRGSAHADNQFRNVLEVRYNTKKERTWLINELPMEMYLRGLAETSNGSPIEYQKALITAARTYALYHFERNTKHRAEGFVVDAWRDQVYKGYGSEVRLTQVVEAVKATEGVVVTYDGVTAVTPYFAHSDGRTRSWSEVWSGDIVWLKGVPVPCDAGRTLFGHGVGMSARGAICMADDGMTYQAILKYFYTGVDLRRDWDVVDLP